MAGIKGILAVAAVFVIAIIAVVSLNEQRTIKATALKTADADAVQKDEQGIPVDAEVSDENQEKVMEDAEPETDETRPSPECILLSRRAETEYEDAKEAVRELERELEKARSMAELEEDRSPRDEAALNQSRDERDRIEDELEEAQRILRQAETEVNKLIQMCGEIIYRG